MYNNKSMQYEILESLSRYWGIRKPLTHNPAPNPVSLKREDLKTIVSKQYAVAEKSDGVRYVLIMGYHITESDGGRPYAAMINRKLQIYQVEVFAPKDLFLGSVFDGELVWNESQKCLNFLIFDAVAIYGKTSISQQNFRLRYACVGKTFPSYTEWNKTHITGSSEVVSLAQKKAKKLTKVIAVPNSSTEETQLFMYSKPFVSFQSFGSLKRSHETSLHHKTDGYIFMPIELKVLRNRHYSMFKWKFEETIDVVIEREDDRYILWCQDGPKTVDIKTALAPYVLYLEDTKLLDIEKRSIIEISVAKLEGKQHSIKCTFHRCRLDKVVGNDKRTILSILETLPDRVTEAELLHISQSRHV